MCYNHTHYPLTSAQWVVPNGYQRAIVKSQWIIAGGCCFWSVVVTFLGLLVTTFTGVVALSGAETF